MELTFSLVIPVYNRPNEIFELLESLTVQSYTKNFEVIIVEDGSEQNAEEVVKTFKDKLDIKYFLKINSGAGMSRNFGMSEAKGSYFIIFDSDCIIPKHYLEEVDMVLNNHFTDAFGGPDAAHTSFTNIQKAINYSMTSFLTTGGLRGGRKKIDKFQPRSFNMGLSKEAFEKTGGFSEMKIGEDIDLTFRLWENNFNTQCIDNAFVYHKRRSTLKQFYKQTFAFGKARPFLNRKYPGTAKITYWFPSLFLIGLLFSVVVFFFGIPHFLLIYAFYGILFFMDSFIKNKKISVAVLSIASTGIQFTGYGLGFLIGTIKKS